jgi:small subunit ribosomal protein S8
MVVTDQVADLLTRIRNGVMAKHRYVDCGLSSQKMGVIQVLKRLGFIENYLVDENKRLVRVFLKYAENREPILTNLKRVSSPGLRRYVGYRKIPRIQNGLGSVIISTPEGVIDGESARQQKLGGEVLCYVW